MPKLQGEVSAAAEESVDAASTSSFDLEVEEYLNGYGAKDITPNESDVDIVINKIANQDTSASGKANAKPIRLIHMELDEQQYSIDAKENGSEGPMKEENDFVSASVVDEGGRYSLLKAIKVSFRMIPLCICESFLLLSLFPHITCSTQQDWRFKQTVSPRKPTSFSFSSCP